SDARFMFAYQQRHSPLRRGVTLDELGGAALYLLSDLSTGVTGEIHFVDSGYNAIAMPQPDVLRASLTGNGNGNGEENAKDAAQEPSLPPGRVPRSADRPGGPLPHR